MELIWLLLVFGVLLMPAILVVSWVVEGNKVLLASEYVMLILVLGMFLVPLVSFWLRYFTGLQVTWQSVGLVSISLSLLVELGGGLQTKKVFGELLEKIRDGKDLWLVLGLGVVVMGSLQFGKSFTVMAGDGPHYLFEARSVMKTGLQQWGNLYDRNIIQYWPAILSLFSGISPEHTVRLMVVWVFALTGGVVQIAARRLGVNKWLAAAMAIMTFANQSVLQFAFSLYAHFAGLMGLAMCVWLVLLILSQKEKTTSRLIVILAFLWASLFNLHAYIAFGSVIFLGLPLVVIAIWQKSLGIKNWKTFGLGVIVFLIASQPLLWQGKDFVAILVLKPVFRPVQVAIEQEVSGSGPIIGRTDEKVSWLELPLRRKAIVQQHAAPTIVLALLAIVMLNWDWKNRWMSKVLWGYWVSVVIAYFLFTQQELFGFSWAPGRFVMGMYFPLLVSAAVGLEYLWRKFTKGILKFGVVGGALVMLTIAGGSELVSAWKGYKPGISRERYNFYQNLDDYLGSSDVVFQVLGDRYRAGGMSENGEFVIVDQDLLFGGEAYNQLKQSQKYSLGFLAVMALVEELEPEERHEMLTRAAKGQDYWLLLDSNHSYIDIEKYLDDYEVVSHGEGVYLLKFDQKL